MKKRNEFKSALIFNSKFYLKAKNRPTSFFWLNLPIIKKQAKQHGI
jgi:hypothetical protein